MGQPAHLPEPSPRRQVELDTGHILSNAKVAESRFRKATGDGRQFFWLKTRAGWREATLQDASRNSEMPTEIVLTWAEPKRLESDEQQMGECPSHTGD